MLRVIWDGGQQITLRDEDLTTFCVYLERSDTGMRVVVDRVCNYLRIREELSPADAAGFEKDFEKLSAAIVKKVLEGAAKAEISPEPREVGT